MKFKKGDIVYKKAGHGFVIEPLICRIDDESAMPCFICDDPECREFYNLTVLRDGGRIAHVSECSLETFDLVDATEIAEGVCESS